MINLFTNQIQFKLENSLAELASFPRFDDNVLKLSMDVRNEYDKYAKCPQELYLFATALFAMATAQGSLEIAENKMAQARTVRIEHGPQSGEMERAALDVYAENCKQKTEDASAAYLHLVFRLNRLMESVDNVASTDLLERDVPENGVAFDERRGGSSLPSNGHRSSCISCGLD